LGPCSWISSISLNTLHCFRHPLIWQVIENRCSKCSKFVNLSSKSNLIFSFSSNFHLVICLFNYFFVRLWFLEYHFSTFPFIHWKTLSHLLVHS
jgi:hypothetical protein